MSTLGDLLAVARNQRTALANAIRDEYASPTAGAKTARALDWLDWPLDWAELRSNRFEILHSAAIDEARAAGIVEHLGPILDELKTAHQLLVQAGKSAVESGQKRFPPAVEARWLEAFNVLTLWTMRARQDPSVRGRALASSSSTCQIPTAFGNPW